MQVLLYIRNHSLLRMRWVFYSYSFGCHISLNNSLLFGLRIVWKLIFYLSQIIPRQTNSMPWIGILSNNSSGSHQAAEPRWLCISLMLQRNRLLRNTKRFYNKESEEPLIQGPISFAATLTETRPRRPFSEAAQLTLRKQTQDAQVAVSSRLIWANKKWTSFTSLFLEGWNTHFVSARFS